MFLDCPKSSGESSNTKATQPYEYQNLELLKLELSLFDVNQLKWKDYRDIFKSMFHNKDVFHQVS